MALVGIVALIASLLWSIDQPGDRFYRIAAFGVVFALLIVADEIRGLRKQREKERRP